jgi:alpha-1,3-mannosylglycoprotein beta-1,4-N-acetylglucosaminyltransferase A/B
VEATLRGLFDTVGAREKDLLRAVVQIGDVDPAVARARMDQLKAQFDTELREGLLEVTRVPPGDEYPPLDGLPQRYNDTEERTQWRAKQALDYALLMAYCQTRGDYYMQVRLWKRR